MRRLGGLLLWVLLLAGTVVAEPEVRTEILAQGQGEPLKMGDHVAIAYRLTLSDGTLVEETPPDKSFRMELGSSSVIPGLSQGLVGMRRGETRIVTVPPELGYGSTPQDSIPANSTLVFEIQLLYRESAEPGDSQEDHGPDQDHAGHDHDDEHGHEGHDHHDDEQGDAHHGHHDADEFGVDGSVKRPHANSTTRPAIMEYLTRDFFTRPWRYDDAPRNLWKGSAVLTLLAVGAALLGARREAGGRAR